MPLLIVLAILVLLVVSSLFIPRHGESPRPEQGWNPTEEVFRDPSSKQLMRVWVDPENHSRHYVPEDEPGS